jgi:hypothetical protein
MSLRRRWNQTYSVDGSVEPAPSRQPELAPGTSSQMMEDTNMKTKQTERRLYRRCGTSKLLATAVALALSGAAYAAAPFLGDEYHGSILGDVQSRSIAVTAVQPGIGDRQTSGGWSQPARSVDGMVNPDLFGSVLNDLGHFRAVP